MSGAETESNLYFAIVRFFRDIFIGILAAARISILIKKTISFSFSNDL